jgi:hypothetical protein
MRGPTLSMITRRFIASVGSDAALFIGPRRSIRYSVV